MPLTIQGLEMHAAEPALFSQDTSGEVLLLHTAVVAAGCAVTAILFRALLILRRTGESLPGLLTIIWILVAMQLSRAAWLAPQWFSRPAPLWLDVFSLLTAFVLVVGIPVAVSGNFLPRESAAGPVPRPWTWLQRAMIAAALLGFAAILCAVGLQKRSGAMVSASLTNVLIAALLLSRILLYRDLQVRRRPLLLFAGCTISSLLALAVTNGYSAWTGTRIRQSLPLTSINTASLIVFLCGVIFVFANVRLADVIVKRALRIVLWTFVSVAVWLLVARSLASPARPAARGAACLAIIGFALAATPVATHRLNLWVDRWVFEQLDLQAAVPAIWRVLRELETQDAVFRAAERFLQTSLSLALVRILPSPTNQRNLPSTPEASPPPPLNTPLAHTPRAPGDIVFALSLEGAADYQIVLSLGLIRPPLTALEMDFVERVAGHIQIRFGTLLAELRRAELLRREALFREELSDAELRALRAQVNPHFLFNSLNTIADLTATAPVQAEEMTLRLAAVFRYILINTDKHFISLREELEFAHSYLHIEQTRFGDRLKTSFIIDPATLDQAIPTLLLQPLIENALRHGLAPKREGGELTIRSEIVDRWVSIAVSDDGVGLQSRRAHSDRPSTRVGSQNVTNRLHTAYGDRASFTLRSRSEGGTEALVLIPRDPTR